MKSIAALRPPVDIDGPRIRMGLLWAFVAFVATATGGLASAVVFAAVALAAAGQSCAAWSRVRRARGQPYRPVAVGGAVLVAVAAASGPIAVTAAAVVTAVAAVLAAQGRFDRKRWDATLTAAIALVIGSAAASVPLARAELGATAALVLLASVFAAEASGFLLGAGARTRFDAPVAATAAVGAVSLAVAAMLVPPFRGASPWILGLVTATLAPAGPRVASALLPRASAFAPALRRLDGFVLLGPVWTLVAAVVLDVR